MRPRPVLVQFWRCGKAHSDRGWSRCTTPEECRDGCVKVPEPSFRCPVCGAVTHGQDVDEGWCPACRAFTRSCSIGSCRRTPDRVAGNIALCGPHGGELGVGPMPPQEGSTVK